MPSCKILINSKAGALRLLPSPEDVQKLIDHLGIDAEVVATGSQQQMINELKQAAEKGLPRIAVAGGDGTVSEAAQHLAGTDTALGIIPQGTANNVATALRLPMDLPSALRVIQDGEMREIDLGRACGRYFTESAGVGLFANALALYGKSNKNIFRALYAIFKIVFSLRASRVVLTLDGEKFEQPAVFCAAANTYRMGSMMPIAPSAKVTDGLLDVMILGDLTRSELIPYYRAIRQQLHMLMPKVSLMRAREITIESRRPIPVHVDDQVRCTTPVTICAAPKALKVLVEKL